MKLNNTSKFDIDLKYGQVREKRVADLLGKEQVEIKTERSWWRKTLICNVLFYLTLKYETTT